MDKDEAADAVHTVRGCQAVRVNAQKRREAGCSYCTLKMGCLCGMHGWDRGEGAVHVVGRESWAACGGVGELSCMQQRGAGLCVQWGVF